MQRSLLFVPAKDKMMAKIPNIEADAFILDLEDSVPDADKENALMRADAFLQEAETDKKLYVRVNKTRAQRELEVLSKNDRIGFMLPKFECLRDYSMYASLLAKHETIALIESALGLVNMGEIASCDWVDACAFGAEDYTASVNMQNTHQYLTGIKSRIVMFAKANGKKVYDTPSFSIDDMTAFEDEVKQSVALGFDGKLAISPKHVACINSEFGAYDIDNMRQIVRQYESAGQAVAVIGGKVYEKMHIARMKRIITENGGI